MYSNVTRNPTYINHLLTCIRQEYRLDPVSIVSAKRGYYGETWRLNTAERSYFLKLDYSALHQSVYERSFPVVDHLCNHGIDFIGQIVKTADEQLSTRFDGAVLGVFNWIDGELIQNERTKVEEHQMLSKVYNVSYEGLSIPREEFTTVSADSFFHFWEQLKLRTENTTQLLTLFEQHREKLEHRAKRLHLFAKRCGVDTSQFFITHGDAGGNIIADGEKFFLVDWDAPVLAPPERDAWFGLCWQQDADAFQSALRQNGIDYVLRPERMAYYCYHSFFLYLNLYLETYFDIGDRNGDMVEQLKDYFSCWIEDEIQYADKML